MMTGVIDRLHNPIVLACCVAGLIVLGLLWWCPYFEARKRKHSKLSAIAVATFYTIVLPPLWIVAMVWAYMEDNRPKGH